MKYEKEFNEIISLYYEDGMSSEEKEKLRQTVLKMFGSDHFDSLIQEGVDNGVDVHTQMEALKIILKREIENEGQN